MMKKILSLLLCIVMLATVFVGCSKKNNEQDTDKGAYIYMYMTDMIYNFDPAHAYGNEAALKIVSLMFDNLFVLGENGKVQKSLAKDYKISEDKNANEYKMTITLNNTAWTDGVALTANDVVYSWKRILDVANSFDAAALLYDIKYAREAKEGEMSIDDVRIYALNETQIEIFFNGPIDYDQFLVNLTSYALAPIREDIIKRAEQEVDWAKKPSTMVSSGPFRLRSVSYDPESAGLTLERNSYYYRDVMNDPIDESVTPYRLIVDYTMTDEELMAAYNEGKIFYVGDIPLSVRGTWKEQAEITDAISTHTYVLNQNAVIRKYNAEGFEALKAKTSVYDNTLVEGESGDKIFAKAEVRKALSLAIDRQAIADAVVFAKAAGGLIPSPVFDSNSKKTSFREVGGNILASSANIDEAKKLLSDAGVTASDYMFAISVPSYDEVHVKIAEMVQKAWTDLGFHVALNMIDVIDNKHILLTTNEPIDGIKDDIFAEDYRAGRYEVAAIDYTALSADAFSMLAPFAKGYTGGAAADDNSIEFKIPAHKSGYNNEEYNAKIEAAFAEKDIAKRATLLHEAEQILMNDLPIIPIIFNQNATLVSKELSKIKFTYYGTPIFTKTKLKDYIKYIPEEEKGK
jgi:oligopeptide transport system substrate-binding protein